MSNDTREIALNARRARFIADHWEDELPAPGYPFEMPFSSAIAGEIGLMDVVIQGYWKKLHPDMARELEELHQQMTTKEFWEYLARYMEGTRFDACGLTFKEFTYRSALQPLWRLEEYAPRPVAEPPSAAYAPPPPPSPVSAPVRHKKWGCHPIGCLGRTFKLLFKLLLPVWLIVYTVKLWQPPYGDAPKPEDAATKAMETEAVAKAKEKKGAEVQGGTLAVGTRVVAKKVVPVYRLNAEKKPVVVGRVPPGGVLEVTGVVNAKVVRVSVELPNGKTAKGLAKVADLE